MAEFTQAQVGTGFSGAGISNLGEEIRRIAAQNAEKAFVKEETRRLEEGSKAALFAEEQGEKPVLKEEGFFGRLDRAYNEGVKKTYLASIYNDIETDALLALNDPKLKNDPVALKERLSASRQGMVENVLPEVSTQVNEQWQKTIDKTVQRSLLSQQQQQIDESNAQFNTTAELSYNSATNNFMEGNFQEGVEDLELFNQAQDALVENGLITEVVAQQRKMKALDELVSVGYLGSIQETLTEAPTPESIQAARDEILDIKDTDIPDMDANQKQAMIDRLNARVNAAAAGLTGQKKAIENKVNGAISVLDRGQDFQGYDELEEQTIALGLTDQTAKLRAAKQEKDATVTFMQQPLVNQSAALDAARKDAKTKAGSDLYVRLEKAHTETKKQLEANPMQFASEIGLINELAPIDLTPEGIDGFLQARSEQAEIVSGNYGLESVSPLTSAETDMIVSTMAQGTASQTLEMLGSINENLGTQANAVYSQMSEKGANQFAVAGALVSQDRDTTAEMILKGREARIAEPKLMPRKMDMEEQITSGLGPVYANNLQQRSAMIESTKSVYASLSQIAGDFSGEMDTERWKEAQNMVTGGIIKYDAPWFAENSLIEAPFPGATADDFLNLLKAQDAASIEQMGGLFGDVTADDFLELLLKAQFESRGSGRYTVSYAGQPFLNAEGGPFILDLR